MTLGRWVWRIATGLIVVVLLLIGGIWILMRQRRADIADGQVTRSIAIGSSSFGSNGTIPRRFTCSGGNVSPEIHWDALPDGTKGLAIVMDDIDTPFGFVHWLVYDIPIEAGNLPEDASSQARLPPGATEGLNSLNRAGYFGPCPPGREPHHYVFRLYALDSNLDLARGKTKRELAAAVRGHVLAEGQITGLYGGEK
jgi:Raf kinase inhibitor-like YbhB/YbcL family protein